MGPACAALSRRASRSSSPDAATSSSKSTASAAVTVETFIGTLPVEGSRFYSFTVPQDGLVSLTLLELAENGAPSSALVNIGIGIPQGTGCSVVGFRPDLPADDHVAGVA